jgi:hypothetical protein
MSLGFGYQGWVGIGSESVYGTPVTSAKYLEFNTESIAVADDVVEGNSVYSLTKDADNFCQGQKKVGGAIEFDVRVQGFESILNHAFGTVTTVENGTASLHGSTHTYGIADTTPTGLTLEINRDVCAFQYHGAKINTLSFKGDNAGILTASVDFIAEDEGTKVATTPTFSTSKYFNFSQCALTIASGTRNVEGFNVNLNNNLTDDRFMLGGRYIKEPQRAGRVTVDGDVTLEFDGTTDWTTFQSAGTGALVATYTGDLIQGTIYNYLKITCPYVRFKGVPINIGDTGRIRVTIPFEGYSQGSTTALRPMKIELSNLTNGTDIL